jgi:hypothetical protein
MAIKHVGGKLSWRGAAKWPMKYCLWLGLKCLEISENQRGGCRPVEQRAAIAEMQCYRRNVCGHLAINHRSLTMKYISSC